MDQNNDQNNGAAPGAAPAPEKSVSIKFVKKRFNLNGKEYVSKDVEAAAQAKEAEALKVIEQLIEIKAACIEIVNPE